VCVLIQVLLYDGVCNLCNGWVNFVIDRDPQSRYKFAALQGEAGRALMTRVGRGELHAQHCRQARAREPASEFEKG
jgi:predicted DCC family thiol-disulfide oxidoreductase YuxK